VLEDAFVSYACLQSIQQWAAKFMVGARGCFRILRPAFTPFSNGWQSLWLVLEDAVVSYACF
jgi:hypothetical protein